MTKEEYDDHLAELRAKNKPAAPKPQRTDYPDCTLCGNSRELTVPGDQAYPVTVPCFQCTGDAPGTRPPLSTKKAIVLI